MRAKRVIFFSVVILVLFVGIYSLRFFGDQHRKIDTTGDILFASDMGSPGKTHIFVVKADGSAPKQLTAGKFDDIDPSFSPDGSQITFVSDRTGEQQVYVMDADGLGARAISFGNDSKQEPKFAPDGRMIGYLTRGTLTTVDSDTGQANVVLPQSPSLTSSNTTQLAQAVRSAVIDFDWSPVSDPNKEQLAAIQQNQDGDLQTVAIVPADGVKPNVVFGAPTLTAAWSPTGSELAVAALGIKVPTGPAVSAIVLYNSDGSLVQQPPLALVSNAKAGPQAPIYTPDGTKIVFQISAQSKLGNLVPAGIAATATASGSQPQILIRGAAHDPEISPDGSKLIFIGPSPANSTVQDIYVAILGTVQTIDLTKGQGMSSSATWSPDQPAKQ